MKILFAIAISATALGGPAAFAQNATTTSVKLGPYQYETKPDHDAFKAFNPRKAPAPGDLLLRAGDRLAICGDSITEQKKYSRIIETYLTACTPQLNVTARQYGWSGEKTDGFLHRMDQDCLTFNPTVATLAYGMNDSRYRPYDATNGRWYEDHLTAVVQRFKDNDVRVVIGSPPCAGKIATWVKSRAGNLQQHNIHLCALRDIGIEVAEREHVRFADLYWPMLQARVFAPDQHGATDDNPYEVCGSDGIHPGWAGQVIMAWGFLRALGLSGEIATITVDLNANRATASEGHRVESVTGGTIELTSTRYPFCATGDVHDDDSIRSGITLIPFMADLNRFVLKVQSPKAEKYRVRWGDHSRDYTAEQLTQGINLAADFVDNPFCEAFQRVDEAVAAKQAYETTQVKKVFHSREAKVDFPAVVARTEAERKPLADAVAKSVVAVDHTITITALD